MYGDVAGTAKGNATTGSAATDGGIPEWTSDTGSEDEEDGDTDQNGNAEDGGLESEGELDLDDLIRNLGGLDVLAAHLWGEDDRSQREHI
jgi:hypothetical protein